MTFVRVPAPLEQDVDLSRTYDAVIVGSGAAGGMAAHVLTAQGMKVLMLEAGKKLPIEQELRSMEWPYDHPRRGEYPPGSHSLSFNEYTIRRPPYAKSTAFKHVYSYVGGWSGSDYVKNILVDEKDHPYTEPTTPGCGLAASGARPTSGAGWRSACPTTTSRPNPTTATVRTGPSPTRTSLRITTRWIFISASPASRKTYRICRTACFSDPPSSTSARSSCARASRKRDGS